MRQLRYVSRAEDAEQVVVETADGLERFVLLVDNALRDATITPRAVEPAPTPLRAVADAIGPREIQMRVRAGEAPQALADAHGMSLDAVLRFAAPVVAERERITVEARRARARRTNADGEQARVVVFGEAVDERYVAYGVDAATVAWNARRREDGEWIVDARWTGGTGDHGAEWVFHRGSRTVTPLDDTAADLLSDRPIRPVAPAPVESHTAPRLAPGVIAFPPLPDANTGPVPIVEDVFDQEAAPEGPRDLPPFRAATPSWLSDTAPAEPEFEEQPLPLAISDGYGRPAAAVGGLGTLRTLSRREESEDDRAARARVPSWDDILLGVRRKSE